MWQWLLALKNNVKPLASANLLEGWAQALTHNKSLKDTIKRELKTYKQLLAIALNNLDKEEKKVVPDNKRISRLIRHTRRYQKMIRKRQHLLYKIDKTNQMIETALAAHETLQTPDIS